MAVTKRSLWLQLSLGRTQRGRLLLQCLQGVEVTQTAEGKDVSTWYVRKNHGRMKPLTSNSQVSNKVFWITKEKEKDLQKDEKYQGGVSLHFPCQTLWKMPKRGARKSLKIKKSCPKTSAKIGYVWKRNKLVIFGNTSATLFVAAAGQNISLFILVLESLVLGDKCHNHEHVCLCTLLGLPLLG